MSSCSLSPISVLTFRLRYSMYSTCDEDEQQKQTFELKAERLWGRCRREDAASSSTCSSLLMALHGSSSRLRWGWGFGFLLENKQGELGTLGMMSERTSLPLAMSLPGSCDKKHKKIENQSHVSGKFKVVKIH